jgi:hypothetical protein
MPDFWYGKVPDGLVLDTPRWNGGWCRKWKPIPTPEKPVKSQKVFIRDRNGENPSKCPGSTKMHLLVRVGILPK